MIGKCTIDWIVTISWSRTPGIVSAKVIKDGKLVINRSNMFDPQVGTRTICVRA